MSTLLVSICAPALLALTGCGVRENLGPVADAATVREIHGALSDGGESTGGADEAAASTGTGWATIRGRFIYGASPPSRLPYAVNKDQATCSPGGQSPLQETLRVDNSTNGIKNIAVYLRDASRVHESAQPSSGSVVFDQKSCVFLTHVLPVAVGQTLELKNSDDVGHNTKITGKKNTFNQTIASKASVAYKIQREEATPAPVNCSIHPWMIAYLLPRENGYVAVTADDGSFEIANLPAGEELEFQVWHEIATGAGGGLVVSSPDAKALKWSKQGRFTVTLQPDEVKEIELTVPATAFRG